MYGPAWFSNHKGVDDVVPEGQELSHQFRDRLTVGSINLRIPMGHRSRKSARIRCCVSMSLAVAFGPGE